MDLVDLDLCVVLPISALDAWVKADPADRRFWLAGEGAVTELAIGGELGWAFRRERPRPTKAIVSIEPRRKVAVVITGNDARVRAAIDEADEVRVLSPRLQLPSSLLVIGGDLAHADVAGGTPVAGPHRVVDLAPGAYRVELRTVGELGDPGLARVIVYAADATK